MMVSGRLMGKWPWLQSGGTWLGSWRILHMAVIQRFFAGGMNEIYAPKKIPEAWTSKAVIHIQSALFDRQQSGVFHNREMLGNGGCVRAHQFGEVAHTALSAIRQNLGNQHSRWMRQCFDDMRSEFHFPASG